MRLFHLHIHIPHPFRACLLSVGFPLSTPYKPNCLLVRLAGPHSRVLRGNDVDIATYGGEDLKDTPTLRSYAPNTHSTETESTLHLESHGELS